LRQPLTERYRERLAGVLSCYDRIIVTGTLPGACYAKGMTGFLSARQIRIFDYPRKGRHRCRPCAINPAVGSTGPSCAATVQDQRHRRHASCRSSSIGGYGGVEPSCKLDVSATLQANTEPSL
jgi:hypothetical protein